MITAYSDFKNIPSKGIYNTIRCKKGDKEVVLKQLRDPYASQAKYKSVLHREYSYGKKIDSPYVVKYLGEEDLPDYGHVLVVEYVEARPLTVYLSEEHSDEEKIDMIKRIAEALNSLHQLNLICGVLNPYTIMVTRQDDRPVITELRGTYNNTIEEPADYQKYISPEQKDGTITVDRRTDIYSIGVLMRDMGLTLSYDSIIKKCCSIGRNDRFYDCDDLIMNLHGSHKRSSNNFRINPQVLAVLAVVVVAAVVVWFGVTNIDKLAGVFQTEKNEAMEQTSVDSTASENVVSTIKTDSSATQTSTTQVGKGTDFTSIVSPNVKETLDKVYQPYIEERQSGMTLNTYKSRLRPLRSQVKKAYKTIARDLGSITNDERQIFDNLFAEYNKQKQQEFATCAPLK
jgi:serine/threonine-protein kinase